MQSMGRGIFQRELVSKDVFGAKDENSLISKNKIYHLLNHFYLFLYCSNLDEAIREYKLAAAIEPNYAEPYAALGIVYGKKDMLHRGKECA